MNEWVVTTRLCLYSQAKATDDDEGPNSRLSYSIRPLDGTPDNVVEIAENSGDVIARTTLDYETRHEYRWKLDICAGLVSIYYCAAVSLVTLLCWRPVKKSTSMQLSRNFTALDLSWMCWTTSRTTNGTTSTWCRSLILLHNFWIHCRLSISCAACCTTRCPTNSNRMEEVEFVLNSMEHVDWTVFFCVIFWRLWRSRTSIFDF